LYGSAYPIFSYRYRLSISIDTPEGPKSGSSIIEVRIGFFPEIGGRDHIKKVYGEAVYIDLGHGQNVVALLASGEFWCGRRLSLAGSSHSLSNERDTRRIEENDQDSCQTQFDAMSDKKPAFCDDILSSDIG
jgi:hypothetical protein